MARPPSPPDPSALLDRLSAVAERRGFPPDRAGLRRLLEWTDAVLEEGKHAGLTSAKEKAEAVDVLLLSALAVVCAWPEPIPPRRVVDLGTGNGLPGIAAALAWPTAKVFLVERRQKKAEAVRRCLARTSFRGAEVLGCDGCEVVKVRPETHHGVDLVTVRAVGSLADTTKVAAPWLAPGGRIAHWKGRTLAEPEILAGETAAHAAGLRVLPALGFEDEAGPAHLLLYERPRRG